MPETDLTYSNAIKSLTESDEAFVAELSKGEFKRRYLMFGFTGKYPVGPGDDVPGLSRKTLDESYDKKVGSGSVRYEDSMSIYAQADFLASMEKSFRALHRGRAQIMFYGASRYNLHTGERGFIRGSMTRLPIFKG